MKQAAVPARRAAIGAGLVAGVVAAVTSDLYLYLTAIAAEHGTLAQMYTYISSVAWGGGTIPVDPVLFGLATHLGISIGWALAYADLASRTPALLRAPWISGTVFGLLVFLAMQCILLSVHRFEPFGPAAFVNQVFLHTLAFGIPVALLVARRLRPAG